MRDWMEHWVLGGGLVDTIIAITVIETAVLLAYHRQTKRGIKPRDYLLNVMSGLCLMLALRCNMRNSDWYFVAAWLMLAGVAHVTDIVLRLRLRA